MLDLWVLCCVLILASVVSSKVQRRKGRKQSFMTNQLCVRGNISLLLAYFEMSARILQTLCLSLARKPGRINAPNKCTKHKPHMHIFQFLSCQFSFNVCLNRTHFACFKVSLRILIIALTFIFPSKESFSPLHDLYVQIIN